MKFKKITLEYHYLELPAPYSYSKYIQFSPNADGTLAVQYELKYTDRQDFSQEELEDEGFSGDDNERWNGSLHSNWNLPLEYLTALKPGTEYTSANEVTVLADGVRLETIGNDKKWDYFIQELTQAIYETAGWEKPLSIRYCKKVQDKAPIQQLEVTFSTRHAAVHTDQAPTKILEWESIQSLLELYYGQEFNEGESTKKIPNKTGVFSDPGDGFWYDMSQTSAALNKRQQERLSHLLTDLFG